MATSTFSSIPTCIGADLKSKGFKVQEVSGIIPAAEIHARRDYFKIIMVRGDFTLRFGDKSIAMDGTYLFFANPKVQHTIIPRSQERSGYACVFTEDFVAGRELTELLQNSPLFRSAEFPVLALNEDQVGFLTGIFKKMLAVYDSDYEHRDDLFRNCIELIIHEALQIQPVNLDLREHNAAARITRSFLELLEKQFPIDNPAEPLKLRTAQHFAQSLSVHTNYLNRTVKAVTGKPTSVLIAERITAEAKALLQHTNWSVADIAYGLGFEYPTYFNNYFKRITGTTPNAIRFENHK
ncbi:helix-turn-helix domain-containing protein [Chitinophaga sancti]|uniref:AraC-type DNA-binding protein n=1 Tax=Chitinophaga sancti TaxID=1004 RepID=A0A1K1S1H6_9BACT|nr:helix-turn-helix domain-containing protein [Chitinophaga sancti]WQD59754.1 helix-turn-helix domain-containing protein [Chitinophaga sancti]WQG88115.1 helix-turn-helix domain-containing protein [Chitinophaga sancti]SFW77940.1 AraC-type DNA-binding protein [Chitinophaga sancti]